MTNIEHRPVAGHRDLVAALARAIQSCSFPPWLGYAKMSVTFEAAMPDHRGVNIRNVTVKWSAPK